MPEIAVIAAARSQAELPSWAFLQRRLLRLMDEIPETVLHRYVREDGGMMWPVEEGFQSIDGLDDMYESFHNWPLLYLLGGSERFLAHSHRQFDAITRQFSAIGCGHGHPMVYREYEQGYDWMHQGEGYLFFYLLNLADPGSGKNRERSLRYASFYTGGDGEAENYDAQKRMFRCCFVGSKGPAFRNFEEGGWDTWPYQDWKAYYGLPYHDVPGITTVLDVQDKRLAAAMAKAMKEHLKHSDTVISLFSTALVMNAYLHTGDDKYKAWLDGYIDAWRERMEENGGIIPDNVGPDGQVGSAMNGKWYGGYYGWTWPHGFYFIGEAMTVAGEVQALLHGDASRLDWVRRQVRRLTALGIRENGTLFVPHKHAEPGAKHHQLPYGPDYDCLNGRVLTDPSQTPVREDFACYLERDGWFEFAPMRPVSMAHAYAATRSPEDLQTVRELRNHERPDWDRILSFYAKDQGGHEAAWLEYLSGNYPDYPKEALEHAIRQVYARMKAIREDTQDPATYSDSYLQQRNPVTVEALVHLTLGGPLPIYNGGLLMVTLRYFDGDQNRPGLPPDTAALVSRLTPEYAELTLVNISPVHTRSVILQAGAFGEHQFLYARFHEPGETPQTIHIQSRWVRVILAPAAQIEIRLFMDRFVHRPCYITPFHTQEGE